MGGVVLGAGVPAFAGLSHLSASSLPTEGVGAANAKVAHILSQVHGLDAQVAAAEERYSAALQGVAASVNDAISADQDRSAIQTLVTANKSTLRQQVIGLYASGGDLATAAALLQPNGGLTAYSSSTHALGTEIGLTEATAQNERIAEQAAARTVTTTANSAKRRIVVERSVVGIADRVQSLLSKQQTLLSQARSQLADAKSVAAAAAALTAESSTFSSDTSAGVNAVGILPPSAEYLALYQHAAPTCPGLSWTVLAAIGQVESGHGRNEGPSSAGAEGPMQFEPATFASYAVNADPGQPLNIDDPADAIFTAAHYLCANGAGRGGQALFNAILHYNHADWYVELVLGLAQKYASSYGT